LFVGVSYFVLIGKDALQSEFLSCVTIPSVAYPEILFRGGDSTNSVEDRENGDLGAVAP
jgi:hypothetical protein